MVLSHVCVCVWGWGGGGGVFILTAVIFSDSRMSAICDSAALIDTGSVLYLINSGYPSSVRSTDTYCSCSVETTSCSSKINVFFVHVQLADGDGSCTGNQKIEIDDKETINTFTCNNNTGYSITHTLTSSSNFLKVALNNLAGTDDGHFWIGFEGMFYFILRFTVR